jgi:ribonuclease T2
MIKKSVAFIVATIATTAFAQQSCTLPRDIDLINIEPPAIVQNNTLAVDEYLLALSWSPNYCAGADGRPGANFQCTLNKFTWVVHGLWPGSSKAKQVSDQPAYCSAAAPISQATYRKYLCLVPGVKLMSHEWAKHGTCGFTSPENYFAKAQELQTKIKLPDAVTLAKNDPAFNAGKLRAAFASSNPGLSANSVVVDVDRKQRLREVRICYDKQFRYATCSRRGAPDRIAVKVTSPR